MTRPGASKSDSSNAQCRFDEIKTQKITLTKTQVQGNSTFRYRLSSSADWTTLSTNTITIAASSVSYFEAYLTVANPQGTSGSSFQSILKIDFE